jgi:hypothetical protein
MPDTDEDRSDEELYRRLSEVRDRLSRLESTCSSTPSATQRAHIEQAEAERESLWREIHARYVAELNAMANLPDLVFEDLGGECPVQGEGTYRGKDFYFRARHESWSLRIDLCPEYYPLRAAFETWGDYGEEQFDASFMPIEDAVAFIRQGCLEYDAHMPIRQAAEVGDIDAVTWGYVLWKWHFGRDLVATREAESVVDAAGLASLDDLVGRGLICRSRVGYRAAVLTSCYAAMAVASDDCTRWPLVNLLHRAMSLVTDGQLTELATLLEQAGKSQRVQLWTLAESFVVLSRRDQFEWTALQELLKARTRLDQGSR